MIAEITVLKAHKIAHMEIDNSSKTKELLLYAAAFCTCTKRRNIGLSILSTQFVLQISKFKINTLSRLKNSRYDIVNRFATKFVDTILRKTFI